MPSRFVGKDRVGGMLSGGVHVITNGQPGKADGMKKFGRGKWMLAGAVFGALALAGTYGWLRASLPDYSGELSVAGLGGTIEIVRDARAIPHIFAATREDGYFGLGFVHAQDRLWQLETTRRAARGRLSEAVGSDALPTDKLVAAFDIEAIAARTERQYSQATRSAIRAYVAGINAALDARRGPPPPEFLLAGVTPGHWEERDVSRVAGLLTLGFGDWRDELLRARLLPAIGCDALRSLFASPADGGPVTHPDASQAASAPAADTCGALPLKRVAAAAEPLPFGRSLPASNSWAIAGARAKTGKPMLANDPHGPLTAPADYYPVRIVGTDFEIVGASRPGSPGFASARNRDIAWGITDVMADQTDLFVERLDPADPSRYLTPSGPRKFLTRTVTIPVKDAAPERVVLRYTANGPVLSDIDADAGRLAREQLPPGHVVALAGVQFPNGQPIMEAFAQIAAARDWPTFERAIGNFHFQHNFAFADRSGTIAMATAARIPRRSPKPSSQVLAASQMSPGGVKLCSRSRVGIIISAATPSELSPIAGPKTRPASDFCDSLIVTGWTVSMCAEMTTGLPGPPASLPNAFPVESTCTSASPSRWNWSTTKAAFSCSAKVGDGICWIRHTRSRSCLKPAVDRLFMLYAPYVGGLPGAPAPAQAGLPCSRRGRCLQQVAEGKLSQKKPPWSGEWVLR